MLGGAHGTGRPVHEATYTYLTGVSGPPSGSASGHFSLGWLLSTLRERSFGVVMLFLGVLATAPIGSSVPGLMLAAVAVQMIRGSSRRLLPAIRH